MIYVVFLVAPLHSYPVIAFTTEQKAKEYVQEHRCPCCDYYYEEIKIGV